MQLKSNQSSGIFLVTASYIIWGFLTIFWNLLAEVDSLYILAQRIIWSVFFMGGYIVLIGKWSEVVAAFKNRRTLLNCFISGILITVNWGTYIIAVNGGHVLDASLGYFIEPLAVVLLGVILFKERMSKGEIITLLFAIAGLIYMIVVSHTVPIVALIITVSFSAYGAVKKSLDLSAHTSLFIETLFMAPFALALVAFMEINGSGSMQVLHGAEFLLLPACGIVTSVPLVLYNTAIKRIPYYLVGILNYISPSIQFVIGLVYFHEALDTNRLIAFILIWIGILFTIADKIKLHKHETES